MVVKEPSTSAGSNGVLRASRRAAAAPPAFLDGLGRQVSFYGQTVATVPRTLRRYREEIVRLIAEVSMGSGALAVIGGTLMVVAMLAAAVGYEVGQQGTTSLGRIGLGAFAGFITASNTGAMALIGPLQMDTGAALGVPPPWSNGLHNAAAGWGIVAGPARIQVAHGMAAGAQSPQMPGWTVTRRNLFVVLLPAMLAGILGMAVMGWFLLPR